MDATFALSLGILNVEVSDAKTKTFNNVFPIKSSIAAATNKDETTMMEKSLSLSLKDSLKGQIPTREWASTEISRGKSSNYFITGQIFYHKNEFVRKKKVFRR